MAAISISGSRSPTSTFFLARWFDCQSIALDFLVMHFLDSVLGVIVVFEFLNIVKCYDEGIRALVLDANNLSVGLEPVLQIFLGD